MSDLLLLFMMIDASTEERNIRMRMIVVLRSSAVMLGNDSRLAFGCHLFSTYIEYSFVAFEGDMTITVLFCAECALSIVFKI